MRHSLRRPPAREKSCWRRASPKPASPSKASASSIDCGMRRYSEFDPATRHEPAGDRQGVAGSRGSTPRACRPFERREIVTVFGRKGRRPRRSPQTPPEILNADLAPLALELACWGAMDAGRLRWLDPPPAAPLAQARELLLQLEAIDGAARITTHGRMLAKSGMHPRLAHMLDQGAGSGRGASRLRACRHLERAGHPARESRRARCRFAAAGLPCCAAMNAICRRASRWIHAPARRRNARSSHWQRDLSQASRDSADPHQATGILLAWAYPDRIAQSRGDGGRYLLANGRGARFAEAQALAKSEFIVAAELDGAEREARIFLAAPIGRDDLNAHFGALIREAAEIRWDERSGAVSAKRERRLGALLLASSEHARPGSRGFAARAALGLQASRDRGAALDQGAAPMARACNAHAPIPDQRACALARPRRPGARTGPREVGAALDLGIHAARALCKLDLGQVLRALLTHPQVTILEREAPTHFAVPSGSRIPIDYLDGPNPDVCRCGCRSCSG